MMLGLYPADFRDQFGREMLAVFEQAAAQHRERGSASLLVFFAREIVGLAAGAARERVLHAAGDRACEDLPFPSDIAGAEKYLELISKRLIHAIANHDFPNARYYNEQDRKARALLAALRARPN
ncbi:MAG TPA: hypothetical protein VE621_12800 [Bryobacteraceae bacterium]|nr:hypothetical protein [Bryobacteraceae bacterium]